MKREPTTQTEFVLLPLRPEPTTVHKPAPPTSPTSIKTPKRVQAAPGEQLLMTVKQAATALAVSPRSIWRLLSVGELTRVHVGKAVRIRTREITQLIERGGTSRW